MRYAYKTEPYLHQHKALLFLLRNRGGGLQVPMRWGKTKVGIDFAGALHLLEGISRVLVVTVVDGVDVWHNEIAKHCAAPWLITTSTPDPIAVGSVVHRSKDGGVDRGLWFRVVNWESTYAREPTGRGREWVPMERADLHLWAPDLVIVDESHHAGDPTSVQHKHVYRLCRQARRVLVMTGTMFHRRPFYVFGQAKLYDPGIFGTNWGHYKRRVAVMGGYGGYEVLRYRNLKWMMRRVRPWCHIEKYVPPRKPVINFIPAHLTGRNREVYAKMERDAIVRLGDATASADIVLTKHLRLQQLSGGWARTDKGYKQIGRCKLAIAESRLREYREQGVPKAVVVARFLPELADLAKAGRRAGFAVIVFHGGLPKGRERTRRFEAFNATSKPVLFIAQIQSVRESIDLSTADTMMLYSLSESYLDYDQVTSRIEKFKDKRTLMYDHIVAVETRDEVTWESMQEKRDVAEFIADDPERVERIVAANVDRRMAERKVAA